jgi:hypothetical protein
VDSTAPGLLAQHPNLPAGIAEYYIPAGVTVQRALTAHGGALRGPLEPLGLVYKPALLAQAEVRYLNPRYDLDYATWVACLLPDPGPNPDWEAYTRPPFDPASLTGKPLPQARYIDLPTMLSRAGGFATLQKDFLDWVFATGTLTIRACEPLKVYASPGESDEEFYRLIDANARARLTEAQIKLAGTFDQRLEALKRRIERQKVVVDRRADEVGKRKAEQGAHDLEFIASVFSKRKRSLSISMSKRRMTSQALGELDEARQHLENLNDEWKTLAAERQAALQRLQAGWHERAAQVTLVSVPPKKKDILLDEFGLAWLPYYLFKNPDGTVEFPAF